MALEDFFESFELIRRNELPDGYGGIEIVEEVLTTFRAGIASMQSDEAIIAGRTGEKTIFRVTTLLRDELEQHDIIRRISDGFMLRVTSDARNKTTPAVAQVKYRVALAEVIG